MAFSSVVTLSSPPLSLIWTPVIAFTAHPHNLEWSHLAVLNLITSTKTFFFPNKVTFRRLTCIPIFLWRLLFSLLHRVLSRVARSDLYFHRFILFPVVKIVHKKNRKTAQQNLRDHRTQSNNSIEYLNIKNGGGEKC